MNKLFTKVAALTLGVAMAAGVGVALGSAKASEARAVEALSYTLTPASGSNNSYAGNCDIAISGITWNLTGNSQQIPWRIGGGKNTGLNKVNRELYSKTSLTDDISRIEVTHGAASGITINSWTLVVSTHDDFSSPVSTLTPTFATNTTTSISRPSGVSWAGCYYKFVYNVSVSGTSNKYLEFTQAKFYRESSNPRGTLEINEPEANVFTKGDKFQVSYSWTPASGSSATVSSSTWSSSDSEVLSVENNVFTAVAPGYASVVLNATDSIGEEYEVISKRIYVSESYGFAIGDEVALISSDPKFELKSISDTSTKYGVGVAYTDIPAGTFALAVEAGSVASSFAFKNGTNYLSWSSGNSLNVATEKSESTSWFVVEYGSYTVITNCSDLSRELWWNNTKDQERFACYTSKTQETENFTSASLYKLGGEPEPELVSIAVSGEYKTKYGYQAEEFDKEGIVVTATYSDQSQQPVDLKDVEFSGYDKSVLGEQTVTVTYQEKTTTLKVTVYYTATYKPGEGTSEDGDYVEYIENPDNYELVSFEKTGFVAPTGKQFKEWSQGTTGKLAVSANGNLNFTAVYEDIPVAKYFVTYKAGDGEGNDYVVPNIEAGSKHALVTFAQSEFVAPAGQQFKGWQVGNDAELHDAGYEVTVNGDVTVTAIYEAGWSSEMLSAFESVLHGVIPSYDDSVASLEYVSDYSDFEMPFVATEEEALAQLAILCKDWVFDSEYKEYSINTSDGLGEVIGWVYTASGSYSATIQFNQTHYPAALEAEMAQHMHGNVPPVLSNGVDGFVYYEQANMFVTTGAYNINGLSTFQKFATSKGLVLFDSGTVKRPIAALSYTEIEGTAYKYGGLCSDGGIIVVELFTLSQYGAFTINIYYLAQPLSIALSGDYKTVYEYGEAFDYEGMVVTATMSDETEQDVTSSAQFSGFDSLKEGEQTVTVTVRSVSTTYTVTVNEKVLQKIEVTSEPTKVVYKVGDEFDPEGLEVTATYNGGDPVVLDLADVEISGFDSSTSGEKTITVAFGGKTATFTVTVEQGYDADAFAKELLDMVAPICNNYDGKKNNKLALRTVWDTMSQRYATLSNEEKAKVVAAVAKTDGTDLQKAIAFYDYACKKYGLTKFVEGRQAKALVSEHETGNSILPIVVIVASSVAAITAIGVVIALKRRKALLAK
jgi:hypothetical protein